MRPIGASDSDPRDQAKPKSQERSAPQSPTSAPKISVAGQVSYPVGAQKQIRASNESRQSSHKTDPAIKDKAETENVSLSGLYFLLSTAALMFGIWFIGPKLVEEYYYAATLGTARAEYENAVEQLKGKPLSNVSYAYQLVAQKVRPSVVSVNTMKANRNDRPGLGSGVIMSSDGFVMTNAHVLEGGSSFWVELHDRRRFDAELIGIDKISDLALLKINAPGLVAAEWGDSDEADVGSIVWAVGSPYGFQQTITSGIISAKDRPGDGNSRKKTLLQTDAAVNPGNSGGPLVDAQGRVIGINTSIFGDTFQGISFAVPSRTAMFVYEALKENGRVTRGYLGARPSAVSNRDVRRMNLPDLKGAKLMGVEGDSPAARAGIRPNDIIRSWDGKEIIEHNKLYQLAEMTKPNSTVDVTLMRNGQEYQTKVTVGQLPTQE